MATAANHAHNGASSLSVAVPVPPLLEIVRAAREVLVSGREVALTRLEFSLLDALAERPSAIVTKERLLRDVWGYRTLGRTRTIDAHACRLRQKLADARLLHNARGVGYRLVKRQDAAGVLVGERPAPRADSDEERPARPLALVRAIDPAVELAAVELASARCEPLLVLGSRRRVAALIESARDAGRALVELRRPSAAPVSVNPAHVALVTDPPRRDG